MGNRLSKKVCLTAVSVATVCSVSGLVSAIAPGIFAQTPSAPTSEAPLPVAPTADGQLPAPPQSASQTSSTPAPAQPQSQPQASPTQPASSTADISEPAETPSPISTEETVSVISGPDFDISVLPNGYYRVVSVPFPAGDISDDELRAQGVSVFRFRKFGEGVTGIFGDLASGAIACVSGTLDDGQIIGTAYSQSTPRHSEAGIYLGQGDALLLGESNGRHRYFDSTLDLSNFSLVNAGDVPPPESCV